MALCKLCNKSGWLLRVSENGLCRDCEPIFQHNLMEHARIINSCTEVIEKSKNLDTILSRLDLGMQHLEELKEYEVRDIPTMSPSPSEAIRRWKRQKSDSVVNHFRDRMIVAREKSKTGGTLSARTNAFAKILGGLTKYQIGLDEIADLKALKTDVQAEMATVTVDFYVEAAQKAEFKGQKKKAVDQYLDALFSIRTDVVDDSLQKDRIEQIEAKIVELGGEVPRS